ncbi:MAG: S8 family serine peptidase [Sandaracinaceae bacterium]
MRIGPRTPLHLRTVCALWAIGALAGAPHVHAQVTLPTRAARPPLIEVARARVGADVVFERAGLRGRRAALCLVDTGADGALEGLRDVDDRPRVRWVWDPLAAPRGAEPELEGSLGGAVWGPVDVDEAPGDAHGHGTAMAAIALGDGAPPGQTAPGPTAGIAPAATLLVARAYDPVQRGFPDELVVRGIAFCLEASARDPELDPARLVILLSLGSHDGAHDGNGAFERSIVRAAGRVPVVVAAGNDGQRAVHAAGRVLGDVVEAVDVRVPAAVIEGASVVITARFEARAADAAFVLRGPEGETSPRLSAPASASFDLGGAHVNVTAQEGETLTHRIELATRDGALAAGTYSLLFEGDAAFEVWIASASLGDTLVATELGGAHVVSGEAIRIPATAPELIAVGASVAREAVTTAGGVRAQPEQDGAASFSSVGPSPAGVPKPDLVAPGGWLLVPLATDVEEGDPDNLVGGRVTDMTAADGRVAIRGTSASAAVVAGALLLMAERDPTRLARARELLIASARGERWTPSAGWGELDAERLLERWGGSADPRRAAAASRDYVPSDGTLWITARADGSTLGVALGRERFQTPLLAGSAQIALPLGPRTVGDTLRLDVDVDGAALETLEVPVRLDRGVDAELRRGGCAIAAPGDGPPPGLLAIALGLFARRRRTKAHSGDGVGSSVARSRIIRNERT